MAHRLFLPIFIALMMLLTVEALAAPTADAVGIAGAPCGYLNVGHAIAAAADGDTIYLSPGVYNEVLGTIDRDLHFVAATPDCTEVEPDATPLDYVIDGGGAATFHGGMANIATNRTVTFTRVLLQNAGAIRGGLLYVESGATLTLNRVRLGGGHADDVGGIIHVAAGASLFLNGPAPVYAGNAGNAGGALYLEGYAELSGAIIRSSNSLSGGAVAMAGDGHLVVTDSWIGVDLLPNAAAHGGGLYMTGASRLELHGDSHISSNQATVGVGGGIFADGNVTIQLYDNSVIHNNSANAFGGGIYAANGATLAFHDSSQIGNEDPLQGNSALSGGGLYATGTQSIAFYDGTKVHNNTVTANGAGVHLDGGAVLTMSGAEVTGNVASVTGGGVVVADGEVWLNDAILSHNKATFGGGIALSGPVKTSLTMTNTQILSNTASAQGGGILASNASVGMRDTNGNTRLAYNTAGMDGGGAYFSMVDSATFLGDSAISQLLIQNNTAGNDGGGVYAANGQVNLVNTVVHTNHAGGVGGGLFLSNSIASVFEYDVMCQSALHPANTYCSEFRHNTAVAAGGAIYTEMGSELSLLHTAVISNDAPLGGALASMGNGDHLEITNSLLAHNAGKAVYVGADGFLDLAQSTLAGNDWAVDVDDNGAGATFQNAVVWDNDFGVESEVAIAGGCSFVQNGVGGDMADPLFISTTRGEFRLHQDSPAVDACSFGLDRDLDGAPRPQGTDYDSGAFETAPIVNDDEEETEEESATLFLPVLFR